jgi:uncharacterized protein YecT (DUF1311 family)
MRNLLCALGPIMVICAMPALAQEAGRTNAECVDAGTTQVEMTACARENWKVADADLNTAFEKGVALLRRIDEGLPEDEVGGEDSLRDAQRAWVTFRDKACEAEGYLFHGGSVEPMIVYDCLARLTRDRTEGLRKMVEVNPVTGGAP